MILPKRLRQFRYTLSATLFALVLVLQGFGKENPDSLLSVVRTASGKDKFYALKALSKFYKTTEPLKSLDYAEQQLRLAAEMKNRELEAEAISDMAVPIVMMQQNKRAILLLQESLNIYDSLGNEKGRCRVLNSLGLAWSQNGSMDKALQCYIKVIPYYTKQGMKVNLATVYMNIGLSYEQLKKHELAISAGLKAKEIFTSLNDESRLNDVMLNLGLSYHSLERFDEARECFEKALAYYEKNHNVYGMAVATTNLVKLYEAKKDYANAQIWFAKALPLVREIHNTWAEASLFIDRAVLQYNFGKFNESLIDLATANSLNITAGDPDAQAQIFHTYYLVYDTLRQERLALEYFKKYSALSDTLHLQENARMTEELTIGFESAQKEAENQILRQDIKTSRMRQQLLTGLIVTILLTSFLIILLLNLKRRNLELKHKQTEHEKQLKEVELEKISFELQLKDQELVYQSMLRVDLTQINRSVQEKLAPFNLKFSSKKDQSEFMQVIQEITRQAGRDPLADFEILFTQLHKSFYENLIGHYSTLSKSELQVCGMIRMNLSTKDIARMMNLSATSVEMTRHRIRQKLNLGQKDNLTSFLMAI